MTGKDGRAVRPMRQQPRPPDIMRKGGPHKDERGRTGRKAKHKAGPEAG